VNKNFENFVTGTLCARACHFSLESVKKQRYVESMGNLYIGTCSWKYPSWEGLVYTSATPADALAQYAQAFNSVEIDQWFWSLGKNSAGLPKEDTVLAYHKATPSDFRFTIKCPNALTLTHQYKNKGENLTKNPYFLNKELFIAFIESLQPLIPKIGLLIFQFEYLNQQKIQSKEFFMNELGEFFDSLPQEYPYGLEIRNPKWMDGSWFTFLSEHTIVPVLLQGYWMDDVWMLLDRYEDLIGDSVCVRLHGDDRSGIEEITGEEWNQLVMPRDNELSRIAQSVKRLYEGGRIVYVNVNNHYEGSAPLTIGKLKKLLD
jgi:uncharacterized protein YecE (DUF72 family)